MNRREWLHKSGSVLALAAGSLALPKFTEGEFAFLEHQAGTNLQQWLLQTARANLDADVFAYASVAVNEEARIA